MSQERTKFEYEGVAYFLRPPTVEENRLADVAYSKAYRQGLDDNLLFISEMEQKLKERGVLNEAYYQRVAAVEEKMKDLLVKFYEAKEPAAKAEINQQYQLAKQEFFLVSQEKSQHMLHTIESKCDEARVIFLLSQLVEKEDKTKVWPTLEALKAESNHGLVMKCVSQLITGGKTMTDTLVDETEEEAKVEATEPVPG